MQYDSTSCIKFATTSYSMPQALLSTFSPRRVNKLQYITKRTQIVNLSLPKSKLLNKLIDWG